MSTTAIMITPITITPIPMITEGGVYRLMAWLSPSFPVGAFSYSHGIEFAVETGRVTGRVALEGWIAAILRHGAGRIDADLFRDAWQAAAGVPIDTAALMLICERADSHRGTSETALESRAQGTAFLSACRAAWPDQRFDALDAILTSIDRPAAYAVCVAVGAASAGVPLAIALSAYLHAFAANLVSAGVRLVPLGQTDGQRALASLESVVAEAVGACLARAAGDFGACAIGADLASISHETQYTRLFRS